jgi:hypothetical protein
VHGSGGRSIEKPRARASLLREEHAALGADPARIKIPPTHLFSRLEKFLALVAISPAAPARATALRPSAARAGRSGSPYCAAPAAFSVVPRRGEECILACCSLPLVVSGRGARGFMCYIFCYAAADWAIRLCEDDEIGM